MSMIPCIKESKYRFIGYLIKYKFGFNKFVGYELDLKSRTVAFKFINSEGFSRCKQTTMSKVRYFKEQDVASLFIR